MTASTDGRTNKRVLPSMLADQLHHGNPSASTEGKTPIELIPSTCARYAPARGMAQHNSCMGPSAFFFFAAALQVRAPCGCKGGDPYSSYHLHTCRPAGVFILLVQCASGGGNPSLVLTRSWEKETNQPTPTQTNLCSQKQSL